MTEHQSIKGREVWLQIDPHHVHRENPNIIPTEYFTATYYLDEPEKTGRGVIIRNEEGEPKLFESPVAALSFARKKLEDTL